MPQASAPRRLRRVLVVTLLLSLLGSAAVALRPVVGLPIPATIDDFSMPGTQPLTLTTPLQLAQNCSSCHGFYDAHQEPYTRWLASMMAQATRDPIFHACLAIAEQDLDFAGDLCLRCHTPNGWLEGRSQPTDGSGLDPQFDFDGVSCHFCHRLVDPRYDATENPPEDAAILAGLGQIPPDNHSGMYIVDPEDRRRGPFDLGPSFFWHEWRQSPYHRESLLCGTCHDVSNPAFVRTANGDYVLSNYGQEHPTHSKYDQFPVERTFSEWSKSDFAEAPIEMGGRFGGNKTAVSTCQDCHMPKTKGEACQPGLGGEQRSDLPLHDFNGGNTWVLRAIRSLYPDSETGLDPQMVDDSIARAEAMLENASDMELFLESGQLVVRVVNQSGHKLPTGYGEGRRMWINVRFLSAGGTLIAEHGAYDPGTAVLTPDTTVFEIKHGLDAYMAGQSGLPAGESFHFAINNTTYKDNRIPPRGFSNLAFESVQAEPVGVTYLDEQYWSDSTFAVPPGATRADVRLYFQTTSREYIEFLRDANTTNAAGQVAYDQWVLHGKSAPVEMDRAELSLQVDAVRACPEPLPIGTPTETSVATLPTLEWQGTPSYSANDFQLRLSDSVPSSSGALFWSSSPASSTLTPGWGTLHLAAPMTRQLTFQTNSYGSTGWIPIPVTAGMVGTERYYQMFVRDPAARGGTNLSTALHVDFCQ